MYHGRLGRVRSADISNTPPGFHQHSRVRLRSAESQPAHVSFVYHATVRRFWRIVSNALLVLSMLLCILSVALWVRSYWGRDLVLWSRLRLGPANGELTEVAVFSDGGRIELYGQWERHKRGDLAGDYVLNWAQKEGAGAKMGALRFGRDRRDLFAPIRGPRGWGPIWWRKELFPGPRSESHGSIDFWLVTLVLAIVPGLWALRWWGRRKKLKWISAGRCGNCGYDLRATRGRCPECGREPELGRAEQTSMREP